MLAIDAIARRYGILPHEVLELDPWALGLARCCLVAARDDTSNTVRRLNEGGSGMLPVPFPVIVVGG